MIKIIDITTTAAIITVIITASITIIITANNNTTTTIISGILCSVNNGIAVSDAFAVTVLSDYCCYSL